MPPNINEAASMYNLRGQMNEFGIPHGVNQHLMTQQL